MGNCFIGTSGWQYSHWRESFYPKKLPAEKFLNYYSQYFNTVEINYSFYRQPSVETFIKWQKQTSKNFLFSIKGNRFISHIKRLINCHQAVKIFVENASVLKGRHIILWQLPPYLKQDSFRLAAFLKLLPKKFRYAVEFRHHSWICNKTWDILSRYNCAAVFQDWQDWPIISQPTANFIYLRFHGNKILYTSNYTKGELLFWAKKIKDWLKQGKDVFVYFNNDAAANAISNALQLKENLML